MSWLKPEPNLRLRVGWHVRIFVALALLVGFVLRFQRLPAPENAAGALPVGNAKGIFQGKHPNFHSQDLSANLYVQHSTVATAITTATTMPNSVSLSVVLLRELMLLLLVSRLLSLALLFALANIFHKVAKPGLSSEQTVVGMYRLRHYRRNCRRCFRNSRVIFSTLWPSIAHPPSPHNENDAVDTCGQ